MIGGGGEKLTLRIVAKRADAWNAFGAPDVFPHTLGVLREHGAAVGRDVREIEVSWTGIARITGSGPEKDAMVRRLADQFGRPPSEMEAASLIGPADEVRDRIARFIEVGVTHFILMASAPFDHETIRRFADEVIPTFHG